VRLQVGEEAKKLFAEAKEMLDDFIKEKPVQLHAIVGIYPASAVGDDIEARLGFESHSDIASGALRRCTCTRLSASPPRTPSATTSRRMRFRLMFPRA
jgi:cobalamin-dependent methionine synthase I